MHIPITFAGIMRENGARLTHNYTCSPVSGRDEESGVHRQVVEPLEGLGRDSERIRVLKRLALPRYTRTSARLHCTRTFARTI